jgi:hypothetical protein
MLKRITLITIAIIALSSCSSTLEPVHDEVIPYDNSKSLAYNVATQGGFHYKLNDVDVPKDSVVRTTSAMGHLANTFLFSANFAGSLGLSLTSDDSHGAESPKIVFSMDVPRENAEQHIANYIFEALKKIDPTSEFLDVEFNGGGVVEYIHQGKICTKFAQDYLTIRGESNYVRGILNSGKCEVKMTIHVSGPSNPTLFNKSKNQTTVRIDIDRQITTRSYMQAFPNGYYYATNITLTKEKKVVPMHIEHKGEMHFFVKPIHNVLPTNIKDSLLYKYKMIGTL